MLYRLVKTGGHSVTPDTSQWVTGRAVEAGSRLTLATEKLTWAAVVVYCDCTRLGLLGIQSTANKDTALYEKASD